MWNKLEQLLPSPKGRHGENDRLFIEAVCWIIRDAKNKIEEWRQDYNDFRPHSSLNNLTPNQFKQKVLSASFSR
nr:integrase core domain-containing protein [Legionella sp. 27cVA30]